MSNESCNTRTEKIKQAWILKGSWLILVVISFASFMGGSTFQAWIHHSDMQIQRESFDKQIVDKNNRIRELNDEIKAYLPGVAKAAQTTEKLSTKVDENTKKVDELNIKLNKAAGEEHGEDFRSKSRP